MLAIVIDYCYENGRSIRRKSVFMEMNQTFLKDLSYKRGATAASRSTSGEVARGLPIGRG